MINSENDRFYTIIEDFNLENAIVVLTEIIDNLDELLDYLLEENKNENNDKNSV